jgi:hypothetical protein
VGQTSLGDASAVFAGDITTGGAITITAITSGTIVIGNVMHVVTSTSSAGVSTGVLAGTTIASLTSGTANTVGAVYQLSQSSGITASSAARFYCVYDALNATSNPVTGGALGFQQTNSSGQPLTAGGYSQSINPINVYSFSLAPEEHQPSGSCNFSRVDTTTLVFDSITGADGQALAAGRFPSKNFPYLFRLYAVNYNIFRVMSGMGGLAYSN